MSTVVVTLRASLHNNILAKAHIQGRATHIIPANIDCGSSINETNLTHLALLKAALRTVVILIGLALITVSGFPRKERVVEVETLHLRALIVDLYISRNIEVVHVDVTQVARCIIGGGIAALNKKGSNEQF